MLCFESSAIFLPNTPSASKTLQTHPRLYFTYKNHTYFNALQWAKNIVANCTAADLSLQVIFSNGISDEGNKGFSVPKICRLFLSQQPDPIPELICVNNSIIFQKMIVMLTKAEHQKFITGEVLATPAGIVRPPSQEVDPVEDLIDQLQELSLGDVL